MNGQYEMVIPATERAQSARTTSKKKKKSKSKKDKKSESPN